MAEIDPERLSEILSGIDPNDKGQLSNALGELGFEMCAAAGEDWQRDTIDHEIARAIIAGMRMLLEVFTQNPEGREGELSPLMFVIAMKHYHACSQSLVSLNTVAKSR